MFKAIYAFFNFIFLVILFKMFAPGLMELTVELFTNVLVLLNDVVSSMDSSSLVISSESP